MLFNSSQTLWTRFRFSPRELLQYSVPGTVNKAPASAWHFLLALGKGVLQTGQGAPQLSCKSLDRTQQDQRARRQSTWPTHKTHSLTSGALDHQAIATRLLQDTESPHISIDRHRAEQQVRPRPKWTHKPGAPWMLMTA